MSVRKALLYTLITFLYFNAPAQQRDAIPVSLVPIPQSVVIDKGKLHILQDFCISVSEGADKRLFDYANRFLRRIDARTGLFFTQGIISESHPQRPAFPTLSINVVRKASLDIQENEAYTLSIKVDKIVLEAETDFGAMHGLETLSQLLANDETGYFFPIVEIKDSPRFKWRSLMIDVVDHFIPVHAIKRNIDGLAMVKMNILHLHLSDNQGWRVESKLFPKLHQTASDGQYYTQAQIKEIVQYANERGIRIVPEINLPSRISALLVAYPELAAVQHTQEIKRTAGNNHSMIDVASEKTYEFLEKLVPEIANLFQDKYFHIGGDDVSFQTLMTGNAHADFLKKNNIFSSKNLQVYFNNRINKALKKVNKQMIAWDDVYNENLDKSIILQAKNNRESINNSAIKGYSTILSNGYELDKMLPAQSYYLNDPLPQFEIHTDSDKKVLLTALQEKNILGGEVLLWTGLVSANSLDSRVWPRTAAIAERLWSAQTEIDIQDMYKRLDKINILLQEVGLLHFSNPETILQLLSGQHDVSPIKILLGVIEPYKNNYNNQEEQLYKTYSPLSLVTDAAIVDPYDARQFRNYLVSYARSRAMSDKLAIDEYLKLWRDNHNELIRITNAVPSLRILLKISENLSVLSSIGIDAIKRVENKISVQKSWFDANSLVISDIRKSQETNKSNPLSQNDARCELAILEDIQMLLDLTNADMAKKRVENSAPSKK